MIFSFGHSEHERVEVEIIDYERSPVGNYWDDNWITVQIRVNAGGFRAKAHASFLTSEIRGFLSPLRDLCDSLDGAAEFTTLEGQLYLKMTGDGKGHIDLVGEVLDQAGIGNRLHFNLHFDQTQLRTSVRELENLIAAFPVRSTD